MLEIFAQTAPTTDPWAEVVKIVAVGGPISGMLLFFIKILWDKLGTSEERNQRFAEAGFEAAHLMNEAVQAFGTARADAEAQKRAVDEMKRASENMTKAVRRLEAIIVADQGTAGGRGRGGEQARRTRQS